MNNKRQEYRGESIIKFFASVIFGPFLIVASLLIDMLALPNLLLKDEKAFEQKYQQSLDNMSKEQKNTTMKLFTKLYYTSSFEARFQNKFMT